MAPASAETSSVNRDILQKYPVNNLALLAKNFEPWTLQNMTRYICSIGDQDVILSSTAHINTHSIYMERTNSIYYRKENQESPRASDE